MVVQGQSSRAPPMRDQGEQGRRKDLGHALRSSSHHGEAAEKSAKTPRETASSTSSQRTLRLTCGTFHTRAVKPDYVPYKLDST